MSLSATPSWLVSEDRIHSLHAHALKMWGGLQGVRETGCVERSIGAGYTAGLYRAEEDSEPDVLTVAVHLSFLLARNHCFADGNKRVAWLALVDQLAAVGLDVDTSQEEVVVAVTAVASGAFSADDLQAWVAVRLVPRQAGPRA